MLRSRRFLLLIALITAAVMALAACAPQAEQVGGEAPAAEEAAPAEEPAAEAEATKEPAAEAEATKEPAEEAASDEPIKLGGLAPLSAPGSVVGGEAMREAMIIAVE